MRAISPTAALRTQEDNFTESSSMFSKGADDKAKAF